MMLVSMLVMFRPSPGMSEWETIQKARELGMVFPEEVAVFDPSPAQEGLESGEEEGNQSTGSTAEGQQRDADLPVTVEVVIPPGSGLESIADILWDQGIIRDQEIFIQLAREMGAARSLKAGVYQLPRDSDSYYVLKILRKGGEGE